MLPAASKNQNASSSGEQPEKEHDYVNAAVWTMNKISPTSNKKCCSFIQPFLPVAVSWVLLLVIIGLRIHYTSVISSNNAKLTVEHEDQMEQIKQLKTRIEQQERRNQQLNTQKQEQEKQNDNFREQIRNVENDVTLSQRVIDAYCPKKENGRRQCEPCQIDWQHNLSSCYEVNDPDPPRRRNWDRAQEDCRGKNSDLVVIVNEDEKTFINDMSSGSSGSSGNDGYWIGLRANNGKWKWIDGSEPANKSWITEPPTKGRCVISVHNEGWKSVNCGIGKRWLCKKQVLSV
ncbi:asialoglycoprotein receptor 1-like [Scomber scombrus]|uniref:Asialoglycoprotein receptor 1-like n=1 Tax=Scomber scombrus TaxID=13677 RepID=A0AAV1QI95_SCOSC